MSTILTLMIYFTIKVIFLVTAGGKCEARKSTIEKTIPAFAAISLIYWQIKQPADSWPTSMQMLSVQIKLSIIES